MAKYCQIRSHCVHLESRKDNAKLSRSVNSTFFSFSLAHTSLEEINYDENKYHLLLFLFVSLHNNNSNSVFDRTFYVFVGKRTLLNFTIKSQTQLLEQHYRVAAIAPWFRLCLPSCGPRVRIPSTPSMLFFNLNWNCNEKRTKINKKRPGLAHFFKKKLTHWF